jgi:hypothetical protein
MMRQLFICSIFILMTVPVKAQIPFTAHDVAASSQQINSVLIIDIDGDLDMDLIGASEGDDQIFWYENDGFQNFSEQLITSTADRVKSIYAADVDSDGDMDVLSASLNDNKIAWYENDGSQNFTLRVISTAVNGATCVYAVDIDQDNDMDVLAADYLGDVVLLYTNDGAQNFSVQTINSNASSTYSVYAQDVDSDGAVDVLSAAWTSDQIHWYKNNGSGNYSSNLLTSTADGPYNVHAADLDSDEDMDILTTSYNGNEVFWYENNGSQAFTERSLTTAVSQPNEILTADMEGDNDLDVFTYSKGDAQVAWHENNGSQVFSSHTITANEGADGLAIGDIDRDGDLDVLTGSTVQGKLVWYEHDSPAVTWDGATWIDGSPDGSKDVKIASSNPVSSFGARNVSILAGKQLVIPAGETVTITGNLLNYGNGVGSEGMLRFDNVGDVSQLTQATSFTNVVEVTLGTTLDFANGHLILEDGATLLIDDASAVNHKEIIAKRIGQSEKLAYNFWSLPLNASSRQVGGHDRYVFDEPSFSWQVIPTTLNAAEGFITTGAGQVSVQGVPNAGLITVNVTDQGPTSKDIGDGPQDYSGFNLIGNPYPAAVNMQAFLNDATNSGILDGTVYFYTGQADGTGSYIPVNQATLDGSESIPAFQGFKVRALTDGNLVFNSSMTNASQDNGGFYRQAAPIEQKKLWLQLNRSGDDKLHEKILLTISEAFSPDFDKGYDAIKMPGSLPVGLYTKVNEKNFSIAALPEKEEQIIPLGMRINESGSYELKASDFETFGSEVQLLLKDTEQGVVHDFRQNETYSFNYSQGNELNGRFEIHITAKEEKVLANQQKAQEEIRLAVNTNGLNIFFNQAASKETKVRVYDLTGRIILDWSGQAREQLRIPVRLREQLYVVEVRQAEKIHRKKVVVSF